MNETSEKVPRLKFMRKKWKIFLIVAILVTAVLVVFISLVMRSTNIIIETWSIRRNYDKGWWESEYTVKLDVAIRHLSVFSVTVRELKVRLVVNGIDMGSSSFPEEWYIIPAFGWREYPVTFNVTGDDADSLGSADTYDVYAILRGKASCMFYTTLFETTSRRTI